MKNLFVGLLLASFSAVSFADECKILNMRSKIANEDVNSHLKIVRMYEELDRDARRTAYISSSFLFIGSSGLAGVVSVSGSLGILLASNAGYVHTLLNQMILPVKDEYTLEKKISNIVKKAQQSEYDDSLINEIDDVILDLSKLKSQIDTSWSKFENAVKLGSVAKRQIGQLYRIEAAIQSFLEMKKMAIDVELNLENCR